MTGGHPKPRLTITIPTVNRPHLVGRAIESAIAQTAQDIEILVSDNGSTDETQEVLARYRDPRLRFFRHENTIPVTAHGNFLIEQARGEFLLALSDDDYLEPDMAARVLELFDRRPDLSFVYTGCWVHYGSEAFPALTGPEVESGTDLLLAYFAEKRDINWCACVTKAADLRAIDPMPAGLIMGDIYYWMKIAFKGTVGCIPLPLCHYIFMTDNVSSITPALKWGMELRMRADEVIEAFDRSSMESRKTDQLRQFCARFVARYTANQFVWNSFRGASLRSLMHALVECLPLFAHERSAWPRVLIALAFPPRLLKRMILRAAARRRARIVLDLERSVPEITTRWPSIKS